MSALFDFAAIEPVVTSTSDPAARISERNRLTDKLFVEDVKRAGWVLLTPGERLRAPVKAQAIVIGIVVWSAADRELLKDAASLLAGRKSVFVVNLDDVRSPGDLDAFMPGVALQTETPVVAEYEDGRLKRVAAGREAQALLTRAV